MAYYIDLYDSEKGCVVFESKEFRTKREAFKTFENIAETIELINPNPSLHFTLYKTNYECGNEIIAVRHLDERKITNDVREYL